MISISDIKALMHSRSLVRFKNTLYTITAYTVRYDSVKGFFYQAELHHLTANSVIVAKLDDLELPEFTAERQESKTNTGVRIKN